MSMLGEQIKELWRMADELDEHSAFIGYGGSVSRDPYIRDAAVLMREAADTIESLRDRLQMADGAGIGECEFIIEDNMNESEGMGDVWFRCTNCDTTFDYYADDWLMKQNYCPHCGAKIQKAVKR